MMTRNGSSPLMSAAKLLLDYLSNHVHMKGMDGQDH